MRISIPSIPLSALAIPAASSLPPAELRVLVAAAVDQITTFLAPGRAAVLTGAGVSVDSGIRAYRGAQGRYLNPHYQPILYHELIDETRKGFAFRQRYWLRSYLGYPPVRAALPNTTHTALGALVHSGHIRRLITQNVDGLHQKALLQVDVGSWNTKRVAERVLELHGTLHRVRCKFGHTIDRETFQTWLARDNPQWADFTEELEAHGEQPRTNPDGDVALEGVSYDDFVVPGCPECALEGRMNSIHKPEVIFFGESISQAVKDRSFVDVESSDRLFVLGTTLATYSAFRLCKRALELHKPVLLLNVGPTRADDLPGVQKIELPSGLVMRDVVRSLLGQRAIEDDVVRRLLQTGVEKPPPQEDDDRAPRAAG